MPQSMEGHTVSQNDAVEDHVDGPPPMRDYKPAKLNPNGADRFWQSHQAEYEARGNTTTDPVERVRRHNAAHPKLRDELERRESLRKVKAFKAIKNACACDTCLKIKKTTTNKPREKSRKFENRSYRRVIKCETENISVVSSASSGCCDRCRKLGLNSEPLKASKRLIIQDSNEEFNKCSKKLTIGRDECSIKKRRRRHNAIDFNSKIKKSKTVDDTDNISEGSDSTVNKKFKARDGSCAHSVATEPSVPSYNSSISLGLLNEPMV